MPRPMAMQLAITVHTTLCNETSHELRAMARASGTDCCSLTGPRDVDRRMPTRLPGSPGCDSSGRGLPDRRGCERHAELIGDRDRDDALLERRAHRLRCEQHETAEVDA